VRKSKCTQRIITDISDFIGEQVSNRFHKWFGGSKIIDDGGVPLICYHGSNTPNIQSFDTSMIGRTTGNYGHYGYGIYFSEDIREAKVYGENIYRCYIKITNPFRGTDEEIMKLKDNGISNIDELSPLSIDYDSFKNSFKNNDIIYSFINSIEINGLEKAWSDIFEGKFKYKRTQLDLDLLNDITDILEYTTKNDDVDGVPSYIFDTLKEMDIEPKINKGFAYHQSLHWLTNLGANSKEVTDVIKKLGYDGVWYGSEIVVFYPNQIKSVTNDGTWDSNDDNIYS